VKLVEATLYSLEIPFVEVFRHSAKERAACDSVVVRVRDETGVEGFGEGVPRPYVTGETVESVLAHAKNVQWPRLAGRELPPLDGDTLGAIDAFLPPDEPAGAVTPNACRAAFELALLDCLLRRHGAPVSQLLPPVRQKVTYGGVITAGSVESAVQQARRMKVVGLGEVKAKVGFPDDVARLFALREVLGPDVSLRIDANGAWTHERALEVLQQVASLRIAALEQPLPRGPVEELARLRRETGVPLMADESLVTVADAEALIAARAVDSFNVRVSKCGGLARSVHIAELARSAGLGVQVGSQVGETAILSAAGRHLAAYVPDVLFVEGSYGTLLLTEDVSPDGVRFGHRGEAKVLRGLGLGVRVLEDRLQRYARTIVELKEA
jgi:L-alanine-DL-glutamate epimerase-like enolase superfamily enzyme